MMRMPSWVRSSVLIGLLGSWVLGLLVASSSFGTSLSQRINDWLWRTVASAEVDRRFVFVDVDEKALSQYGPWPWARSDVSMLIQALRDAGASQVTLDMVFPAEAAGDAQLAEALSVEPRAVNAFVFAMPGNEQVATGVLPESKHSRLCDSGVFPEAIGYLGNTPSLGSVAGHITPRVDRDGVIRATPAFICFDGQAYPSLTLAAFMRAAGLGEAIELEPRRFPHTGLQLVLDGVVVIPLSSRGEMVVPFNRSIEAFERVSAADVLDGSVSIEGRWALLGSSAVGLSDRVSTPLSPIEPGAGVHLRLLAGLLDERAPTDHWALQSVFWLCALLIALSLLVLAAQMRLRWWMAPSAIAVFALGSVVLAIYVRSQWMWLSELVGVHVTVISGGIVATAIAFVQYRVERSELIARLGAYLPLEVATQIAEGQSAGSVDMSRRASVLVSVDLRNFDRWAERLESRLSAAVLHHYVCAVSDRIHQFGGTVLQVSGTRIRAIWPMDADVNVVIQAASHLLNEVDGSFPDVEVDPELPAMGLAIGIEQGDVLMGTYGSSTSRGFSLLGDVALMVQGLVRMTGELSCPCLMGPEFAKRLEAGQKASLGVFLLEESSVPRELFELPTEITS